MRKILFVTGSRADYGHIRRVYQLLSRKPGVELRLVATDMHLLPEFGSTVRELEKDGVPATERILMTLAGYTHASMAKSLGIFQLSLVDVLARERPNLVLIIGDRGEQLMAAMTASYLYIPVAHIQGGDVTGNIDGMVRHAITKFAHLHFAGTEEAAERLRRMGEEDFRVHMTGSPQLDALVSDRSVSPETIIARYNANHDRPFVLVIQHPVTEQAWQSGEHMRATLEAVAELDYHAVVIYPNDDAGSLPVQRAIEEFRGPRIHAERNLSRAEFGGLLRSVHAIIGNSSAGIIEAPSFELAAVNIGVRQAGRLQAPNVINCGHGKEEILAAIRKAVSPRFRASLAGIRNPYGDGRSSERIVEILLHLALDERLLVKRLAY